MIETSNLEKKQLVTKRNLPSWERMGWATALISFTVCAAIYCNHLHNQLAELQIKNKILEESNSILKTINKDVSSKHLFPNSSKGEVEWKVEDDWQQYWMAPVRVTSPKHNLMVMPTEVTQGLYRSISGQNPSSEKGDVLPVNNVTWNQAI